MAVVTDITSRVRASATSVVTDERTLALVGGIRTRSRALPPKVSTGAAAPKAACRARDTSFVGAVLGLQRSLGNRAVSTLLTDDRGPSNHSARGAPGLQRRVDETAPLPDPQPLLAEAAAAFAAGNLSEAKTIYRKLAALPGLPDAMRTTVLFNLATCHQRDADFNKAIDIYMEALSRPAVEERTRRLGLERIRQCRLKVTSNAGADAQTEHAANGGAELSVHAKKLLDQAAEAFTSGLFAGATTIYRTLAGLPGLPDAMRTVVLLNLATCYQRDAEFTKAISIYKEALRGPSVEDDIRRNGLERIRQCRLKITGVDGGGSSTHVPQLTRRLDWGSRGTDVVHLQARLSKAGFALEADGKFFNLTQNAVRQFQSAHDLKLDGKVGKKTWAALHA